MRHLLPLVCLVLVGCEWVADPLDFTREAVPRFKAKAEHPAPPAHPTQLKVMAWNVKYGACRVDFWFDFWGDRVELSSTEVNDCLTKIAALVREVNPDILFTEEIEVGSRRSAYVDMVQFLLENTDLRYAAYDQTWDARYVPSEGVGRIDLGNAIHSRYPIVKAERIKQVDRTDQDLLTSTFYIKRAIGRAEVDLGDRTVAAYVVHTEAYDFDGTKQKQIQHIYDVLQAETLPWVIGGDFNELPPVCDERADAGTPEACQGKLRLAGFLDERASSKGTPYEQPPYTPSVMKKFYDSFEPYLPLSRYGVGEAAQRQYFSHSVLGPDGLNAEMACTQDSDCQVPATCNAATHRCDVCPVGEACKGGVPGWWNRTLDYLFVRKGESWTNTDVLQAPGRLGITGDPSRLSDHAPVTGTWGLP